ncbi:MAG: TrbC/VirB2 family protein [Neisseriaceae bacterium]|nr:TrbC/VirB2 family protein [Neisseriaceae bacterium]
MKVKTDTKKAKLNRREVKEWVLAIAFCSLFSLPMLANAAPEWANTTKGHLDNFITGLKWVGGGIATIVLLWCAYQIIWGEKRLVDMKNWFIGAAIFASAGHIVKIFFPDSNY